MKDINEYLRGEQCYNYGMDLNSRWSEQKRAGWWAAKSRESAVRKRLMLHKLGQRLEDSLDEGDGK